MATNKKTHKSMKGSEPQVQEPTSISNYLTQKDKDGDFQHIPNPTSSSKKMAPADDGPLTKHFLTNTRQRHTAEISHRMDTVTYY